MRRAQIEKQKSMRQRNLERITCRNFICHVIICLSIIIIVLCGTVGKCVENSEDNSEGIVESQCETTRPQLVPTIQVNTQKDEVKAKIDVQIVIEAVYDYSDSAFCFESCTVIKEAGP